MVEFTLDTGGSEPSATCGTCGLWGANFYRRHIGWSIYATCCADAVMDLPASFIPNRQTMLAHEGEGCIAWQRVDDLAAKAASPQSAPTGAPDTANPYDSKALSQ